MRCEFNDEHSFPSDPNMVTFIFIAGFSVNPTISPMVVYEQIIVHSVRQISSVCSVYFCGVNTFAGEALADIEGSEGGMSSAAAEALVVVGELAAAAGDLAAAEAACQRCLMVREELMGPHHTATARCQNNLGGLHARAARWKDAELAFRSSLHAFQVSARIHHT
jgi:hypothetical protein